MIAVKARTQYSQAWGPDEFHKLKVSGRRRVASEVKR